MTFKNKLPSILPPALGVQVRNPARETSLRPGALIAFVFGSFVAHGVAYATLAALPQGPNAPQPMVPAEFTVLVPEPSSPSAPTLGATGQPVVRPKHTSATRRASAKPTPKPLEARPVTPLQPDEAPGPGPLALEASDERGATVTDKAGKLGGAGDGEGESAGHGAARRTVDLRAIAAEWVRKVNLAISARALRDYPRSALRAQLQGSVLLTVQIDTQGLLAVVELKQSSGHSQLDHAALTAARALGRLPAPPEALHSQLRPIRIPVHYRVQ